MVETPRVREYDVFLSHNGRDRQEVERIAVRLREKGFKPFLDKWHLVPGDPWQEALEEALDQSACCAVFVGPGGLSPWEHEEMRSALDTRARQKSFRVIPVLLPGADESDPDSLPRFLKRLTWVDFRAGLDDETAFERFLAGVRGVAPEGLAEAESSIHRLQSGIIHALPPAPVFVGRGKETAALKQFWAEGEESRVLSLVGLGGAGKTAIIAEFLAALLSGEVARPGALFVWSFYVDQEANNFLRAAQRHFGRGVEVEAAGTGLLYRLTDSLTTGERNLFILDGLERVQRPYSDAYGAFGELEDPLLRQVITRFAVGLGRTKCLITSRFPVSDLRPWRGRGYRSLEIDQLEESDARLLLRKHGVRGDDSALDRVIEEFGAHALTLDHLGVFLTEFRGGDPEQAHQLPEPRIDSDIPQERKLARVFYAYEKSLRETELDLLKRVCIFRFGVSGDTIFNLFAGEKTANPQISGSLAGVSREEMQRLIIRLTNLHLILRESGDQYTAHPAVRDHFYSLFTERVRFHGAVEKVFKNTLAFELQEEWTDIVDSYNQWQKQVADFQDKSSKIGTLPKLTAELLDSLRRFTEERISLLPKTIQEKILAFYIAIEGGEVPRLPFSFLNYPRWSRGVSDEWTIIVRNHKDWHVLRAWDYDQAEAELKKLRTQFCNKVSRFIRRHGPRLSPESVEELLICAAALRKGKQVPLPTVRLQHAQLALQPGVSLPEDPATLDLIEELIYHSIKAKHLDEAEHLYSHRLGGKYHLSRKLGEYARGIRILRSFPTCPFRRDLAWYLRGVGDLRGAYAILTEEDPIWAGSILCLLGRLPAVMRGSYWNMAHVTAEFLSGRSLAGLELFNVTWGEAMIAGELYLLRGDLKRARLSTTVSDSPEHVKAILVAAEVERRSGELEKAEAELERAAPWVLRSASVEHLCFYHLIRARLMRDRKQFESADSETSEGIHLARTSKLGLAHIDLLNERARLFIERAKEEQAKGAAERAASYLEEAEWCATTGLNGLLGDDATTAARPDLPLEELSMMGARHPECQYAWGEGESLSLLGESVLRRGLPAQAREPLRQALEIFHSLKHPLAERTRKMLEAASWDS
jgi:hypothetical protein